MIIVNDKLAFLLIPKNASSSIRTFFNIPIGKSVPDGNFLDDNIRVFDFNGVKLLTTDEYGKQKVEHVDLDTALKFNLISSGARVVAIIRDPLERQLSLYFYRHRHKKYETPVSIDDFRSRVSKGYIEDSPWHMKLQTSFINNTSVDVEYWLYEDLNEKFLEFGVLPHMNVSLDKTKFNTDLLISKFYDADTISAVKKYWRDDFILYEKLKNETRESSD